MAQAAVRARRPSAREDSPYWLGPFQNYKTFCPYLVGSYDRVGEELADYIQLGYTTFILDIPPSEEELEHTAIAFERADSPGRMTTSAPGVRRPPGRAAARRRRARARRRAAHLRRARGSEQPARAAAASSPGCGRGDRVCALPAEEAGGDRQHARDAEGRLRLRPDRRRQPGAARREDRRRRRAARDPRRPAVGEAARRDARRGGARRARRSSARSATARSRASASPRASRPPTGRAATPARSRRRTAPTTSRTSSSRPARPARRRA